MWRKAFLENTGEWLETIFQLLKRLAFKFIYLFQSIQHTKNKYSFIIVSWYLGRWYLGHKSFRIEATKIGFRKSLAWCKICTFKIEQLSGPRVFAIWFIIQTHPNCSIGMEKLLRTEVVLCFVLVMQSFIMNSHGVFIHIHQGCFAGTGAIVRLPQCQWSKPDGYGEISQCITTTKHSTAKQKPGAYVLGYTVCPGCSKFFLFGN